MRGVSTATVVLLTAALLVPSFAPADADPASDYLPRATVFYPYQPAVAPALRSRLEQTLAQLKNKGLNLKVAVILNPFDLGAVHVLFDKPQLYAKLLSYEISFGRTQPVLVVMPAGFGTAHVSPSSALRGVPIDRTDRANGLVHSADLAVLAIAKAKGISVSSNHDSGGGVPWLIAFGVAAVLVIVGGFAVLRLRRRSASPASLNP